MSAWSKLQKALYLIVSDKLNFQIHCSVYRMDSQRGHTDIPRYWITLDKEIIFDYPKQFTRLPKIKNYPYETSVSDISNLIREYVDCPVSLLPEKNFEDDLWGITEIFKAADKRLGKKRLQAYFDGTEISHIQRILQKRSVCLSVR